jgi:hypothetical protein
MYLLLAAFHTGMLIAGLVIVPAAMKNSDCTRAMAYVSPVDAPFLGILGCMMVAADTLIFISIVTAACFIFCVSDD